MDRQLKAVVFESDSLEEVQLIEAKLNKEDISTFVESEESIVKLSVMLEQEAKAFTIIDAYIQNSNLD